MDNKVRPESKLIEIIDHLPQMAWYKDIKGTFIKINQSFADAIGKSKDEIIGKTDFDVWPYELALSYVTDDQEVMASRNKKTVEERIDDKGGDVWFETFKTPVFDSTGNVIGTIGTSQEISKRKEFEAEIENQKRFLKSLIDAIPDLIYYKDTDSNYLGCNAAFAHDFLGLDEDKIVGKSDFELVKDRALADFFIKMDQKVFTHKTTHVVEESIELLNGKAVDVETSKTPFLNDKGEVAGLIGVARNITERKQILDKLRIQNTYNEMLLDTVPSAVYTLGNDRKITSWNKMAEKLTGYTESEVLGKDISLFAFHPCRQDCGLFDENIVIPKCSLTCSIISKSGEVKHVLKNIDIIRDVDGSILGRIECFTDITERVNVERLLQESELRLNLANSSAKVGLWDWNIQTGETFFNDQWAFMIGYTPSEIEPSNIQTWLKFCHPDDLEKSQVLLENHFSGKTEYYECEARMKHKDGHWVWIIDRGKVIEWDSEGKPLRMVGTHFDITKQKHAEEDLKRKEKLLSAVAMSIKELIDNRDYLKAAAKCFQMIGSALEIDKVYLNTNHYDEAGNFYTRQIIHWSSGSNHSQISDHETAKLPFQEIENFIAPLLRNEPYYGIVSGFKMDKTRQLLESRGILSIVVLPIYVRGVFWGFIGYEDCTHEKVWTDSEYSTLSAFVNSIEKAIERSLTEKDLHEAKLNAEAANNLKSQFLANISHEIRTPMHAILGYASLMNETDDREQLQDYLGAIKKAGNTLMNLINDILDLSKIEAGKLEIQEAPVDLNQTFEDILETFSYKAKEKNLAFHLEIDSNLPRILILDEVKTRQILFNLVGNAVKFTEEGSVQISVKAQNIDKKTKRLDLVFEVADTGIGIPEDQLLSIFEPFKQKDGQNNKKYGGTGLGLSISKRMVEIMGGTISLKSELNKGSIFTVEIPNVSAGNIADENKEASRHCKTNIKTTITPTTQRPHDKKIDLRTPKEMVKKLEKLKKGLWKTCMQNNRLHDMRALAESIMEISTFYEYEDAIQYAKKLQIHINMFDLKRVRELLLLFPKILENYRKNVAKGGPQ